MSTSESAARWRRMYEEKRRRLLEEDCDQALEIKSLEVLQTDLWKKAAAYSRNEYPDVYGKLEPSLRQLESFTRAISVGSPYAPAADLIWGGVQAVMKIAFEHSDLLDEVVEALSDLNDRIPVFELYDDISPNHPVLQYYLRIVYDEYLEFCLKTVAYMNRSHVENFMRFIWTSKPTTLVQVTIARIEKHFAAFEKKADQNSKRKQHKEIERVFAAGSFMQTHNDNSDHDRKSVSYPVNTVNMFRNHDFMGRDDIFDQMHKLFNPQEPNIRTGREANENSSGVRSPDQSPACAVLYGIGGSGKSQTALEYQYRYETDYDAIFWIQAEQSTTLSSSFADIAERLNLMVENGSSDGKSQGRAVGKTLKWLQTTNRRWLIIFDNLEHIADLNAYLPTTSKAVRRSSVIITTQRANLHRMTDVFQAIPVSDLDKQVGSKLLFRYLGREAVDQDEALIGEEISETLGGLPLAIATIGGYINESSYTLKEFLEHVQRSSNAWEAPAIGAVEQYERTLRTVFEIALNELPVQALDFINMLAFLNPDQIPEELFVSGESPQYKKSELVDIIRVLRKRQLVRRDSSVAGPFFSIHRTVQWNVLLRLSDDYQHRWDVFKEAFDVVKRALPEVSTIDNPEPEVWPKFEKYVPQVLNLRTHCLWPEPPVRLPEQFAQILSNMATFMWHAGLMAQGYDALSTAENIIDDLEIGMKNPLRGNIQEHLGIIASFYGVSQREECMKRRHQAIASRRASHNAISKGKITRDDEIRLWNVQSDMAFGLMQEENFAESKIYIEKCHEQYKKWGTPDDIPFEYLKYNHISSYILMSENNPVEAIKSCSRAVELGKKCAGIDHPMTQLCRFSLTNHLYLANELDKALELSSEVLKIRSKICTEFNLFTLESHLMYGFLLLQAGKFKDAEVQLLLCLDKRKEKAWNQEAVARAQYIYSMLLEKLEKKPEAAEYRKKALKTKDDYLRWYPQYLKPNADHMVVFDQMVCLWGGRFSGRLAQEKRGGANAPRRAQDDMSVGVDPPSQALGTFTIIGDDGPPLYGEHHT